MWVRHHLEIWDVCDENAHEQRPQSKSCWKHSPRPVLHFSRSMSHKLFTWIFSSPSVMQKSPSRFEQTRLSQLFRHNVKLTASYPETNDTDIRSNLNDVKWQLIHTIRWIFAIMYAHDAAVAEFAISIWVVAATNWRIDGRAYIGASIRLNDVTLRYTAQIALSAVSQAITWSGVIAGWPKKDRRMSGYLLSSNLQLWWLR